MAGIKEHEMQIKLSAQLQSEFKGAFKAARSELTSMQNELQTLKKAQSDITAYQKQMTALEQSRQKLAVLRQEYDNIQKEISETGNYSSTLQNRLLNKQMQIERTTAAADTYERKVTQLGEALRSTGINMDNLAAETSRLSSEYEVLRTRQQQVIDNLDEGGQKAAFFGEESVAAVQNIQEALVAAGIAQLIKEIGEAMVDCAKASIEFESAMTGVDKTTNLSAEELEAMSAAVKELSTEIPITTTELAAVAEVAGQLGIAKENLLDFSTTMSMLGTATTMTADEAATMLAQFANITQMNPEYYDELGSAIVDLGNNYATTEQKIAEMSQGIAASASLAGMSEADMLGLSAAMSSLGIETQAGSTAISRLISTLMTAVETGEGLNDFARIAGMGAEDFAQAWGTDAAGALQAFVVGLSDTERVGSSAIVTLTDLDITESRMQRTILSLSNSGDLLTRAIGTANQAWAENSALTNEAEKRYATTESLLKMLGNSYNNLKIAVGDVYTPTLRGAAEVGMVVLDGMAEFVEKNPATVKLLTALAAGVAAFSAALGGYIVVTKLAKIATDTLTAAMATNSFLLTTTAIIGVVTAVGALAATAEDDAVPSVKELTEATRNMSEVMDEAANTHQSTVTSTLATVSVADMYISKLEELESTTKGNVSENQEYRNTLILLSRAVPELSEHIDLNNYVLRTSTSELRTNTDAWAENAKAQAYQEYINSLMDNYNSVMLEAAENSIGLTKAKYDLKAAEEKHGDAVTRMNQLWEEAAATAEVYNKEYGACTDATHHLTQEYYDLEGSISTLNDEVWAAQRTIEVYEKAIEEGAEATAAAKEEIEFAKEAVQDLMGVVDESAGMTADEITQLQTMQATIGDVTAKMVELSTAYTQAYDAAHQSVTGQYALWDQAAAVVVTSADSINSAIESQITYWKNYDANLQTLTERSADIEGLSAIIATFADGSKESVNAIAGMASASDEDLASMVANWQSLQEEQRNASLSIAELKEGFGIAMDELQTQFAADLEAMNLSSKAAESGISTIQGFIDGASGMLPQVEAAYARLGAAAQRALSPTSGNATFSIPGYATGTQSAAPGFALVGEHGPELVYFNGGEKVMTAEETAALRSSSSLTKDMQMVTVMPKLMELAVSNVQNAPDAQMSNTAMEFSAGQGTSSPIEVHFHIEGNATPETIEALRSYGDSFAERVLEVIENAGVDMARRAYK